MWEEISCYCDGMAEGAGGPSCVWRAWGWGKGRTSFSSFLTLITSYLANLGRAGKPSKKLANRINHLSSARFAMLEFSLGSLFPIAIGGPGPVRPAEEEAIVRG